jgi:antibiotic biosynthesis monooxygenase (ABM) superfamily enzyme
VRRRIARQAAIRFSRRTLGGHVSDEESTPLPVTVVVSRRPVSGREADITAWAEGISQAAARFPGHLGAQVYPPPAPDRPDLVIAFSFDTASHLSAWETSEERRDWLARSAELAEGDLRTHVASGFEGLFAPAVHATTSPPPRWKTGVVIGIALFPMSLLLNWLLMPHLSAWPVVLRVALSVIVIVPWMVYLGVPYLTRWMKPWLMASPT